MSSTRALVALIFIVATGMAAGARRVLPAAAATKIDVPMSLGTWRGEDAAPVDEATLRIVAADHIVNREYVGGDGHAVGLYIASYAQQRPGVSIHSPLHCLPGTGWSVLTDDVRQVTVDPHRSGSVRRLVAVRDDVRLLILYWYAIQDRMVANDALSRLYLLSDSVRLGRNDAALVRLVVPIRAADEAAAERQALAFLHILLPYLSRSPLPSAEARLSRNPS